MTVTMPSSATTIGQLLKEQRYQRGLSQADAATLIGVSSTSYARWETDERLPRVTYVPKVAEFLCMEAGELTKLILYRPPQRRKAARKSA